MSITQYEASAVICLWRVLYSDKGMHTAGNNRIGKEDS